MDVPRVRQFMTAALTGAVGVLLVLHFSGRLAPAIPVDVEWARQFWSSDNTHTVYLRSGGSPHDDLERVLTGDFRGPVLTVGTPARLDPWISAELARLRPCLIVAIDPITEIDDRVLQRADRYTVEDRKCHVDLNELRQRTHSAWVLWRRELEEEFDVPTPVGTPS